MPRLRGYDLRNSRFPKVAGLCTGDNFRVYEMINTCQRRLLYCAEAGEEGWWGTWAEIAFNISQSEPHLITPRNVARIEMVDVCDRPVPIRNQFYEYMEFGNGRMPKRNLHCHRTRLMEAYTRNNAVTFTELPGPNAQTLTIFSSDTDDYDANKRVLVQGLDANGKVIRSQDGNSEVEGVFVSLTSPFSTVPFPFTKITGIQKDVTDGEITFFANDPQTGVAVLIHTMEPTEMTAWYRKYFFHPVPASCCPGPIAPGLVQVRAICKLEPVPVIGDTDYTVIQNLEAFIEEAQAVRYSTVDSADATTKEAKAHRSAVRYLNGELTHYLGLDQPAILFKPFGSAELERVKIGMM